MTTSERVTQAILDALDKGVCPWKTEWRGGAPMSIDDLKTTKLSNLFSIELDFHWEPQTLQEVLDKEEILL